MIKSSIIFLDDSVMQLEVLTGIYLGSCVSKVPKGTERAASAVAEVQLVFVVRDTHEG